MRGIEMRFRTPPDDTVLEDVRAALEEVDLAEAALSRDDDDTLTIELRVDTDDAEEIEQIVEDLAGTVMDAVEDVAFLAYDLAD